MAKHYEVHVPATVVVRVPKHAQRSEGAAVEFVRKYVHDMRLLFPAGVIDSWIEESSQSFIDVCFTHDSQPFVPEEGFLHSAETKEHYRCRECDGTGVVEFAANRHNKSAIEPDWREEKCSECGGTGYNLPDDWEYDDE